MGSAFFSVVFSGEAQAQNQNKNADYDVYPKATSIAVNPLNDLPPKYFQKGSYLAQGTFNAVVAYYRARSQTEPPPKLVKKGSIQIFEAWLKKRPSSGGGAYRVKLTSPAVDPRSRRLNPRLTQIDIHLDKD